MVAVIVDEENGLRIGSCGFFFVFLELGFRGWTRFLRGRYLAGGRDGEWGFLWDLP